MYSPTIERTSVDAPVQSRISINPLTTAVVSVKEGTETTGLRLLLNFLKQPGDRTKGVSITLTSQIVPLTNAKQEHMRGLLSMIGTTLYLDVSRIWEDTTKDEPTRSALIDTYLSDPENFIPLPSTIKTIPSFQYDGHTYGPYPVSPDSTALADALETITEACSNFSVSPKDTENSNSYLREQSRRPAPSDTPQMSEADIRMAFANTGA